MKNYLQFIMKRVYKTTLTIVVLFAIATTIKAQCDTKITDLDGDGKDYVCAGSTSYYEAVRNAASIGSSISWSLTGGGNIVASSTNGTTDEITIVWDSIPDSGPYYLTLTETNGCTGNDVLEIYMEKVNLNMACNDLVLIALDNNCRDTITPDEILEAQLYPDNSYSVLLFNTDDTPRAEPIANMNDLGDTLMVMVTHDCTGLACMGNVAFEDNLATMLSCRPDTIKLECDESTDPENSNVGFPLVPGSSVVKLDKNKYKASIPGDCGGEFTLVYADDQNDLTCSDSFQYTIHRTWAAIDASQNSWICTEDIAVKWANFDSVCAPPHFDGMNGRPFFQCNDKNPNPNNPQSIYWPYADSIPGPEMTGYPDFAECANVQFLYEDVELGVCGYTRKILRQWIILDWCSGKQKTCEQVLSFIDDTPPVFHLPNDTLIVESHPDYCWGTVDELPDPIVDFECSDWTYEVTGYHYKGDGHCDPELARREYLFKNTNGTYRITHLPVDTAICVSYKVTDECGLFSYGNMVVIVRDRQQPTAACETHTVVTIGDNAKLYATSLDDESWDNCGIEKLEIRRTTNKCGDYQDLKFGEYVNLCCNDVGIDVMVILRATDKSGNTNECMGWVIVNDKERPVLTSCPDDFTVNCDQDYTNIYIGGQPTASDNCGNISKNKVDTEYFNDCNIGYVRRVWTIKDKGNLETLQKCIQTITVVDPHPLTINNINWPSDITLNGCWPNVDIDESITGLPTISQTSCKSLGIAHNDRVELNPIQPNSCVVIYRTFTVGDWCRPNSDYIEYTQKIYINDGGAPNFINCTADTTVYTGAACVANVTIKAAATDDCTEDNDLLFTYEVDKGNDGTIDKSGLGAVVNTTFERGINKVSFTVTDNCGNVASCSRIIRVKDSKPPTPLCLQKITTSLGTDGTVTINAKAFDHGSEDNCTPSNMGTCGCYTELRFSFTNNVVDSLLTYTCDSLDNGVGQSFDLSVHVFDLDDNSDFCLVRLNVTDSKDVCPDAPDPTFMVQGYIYDENNTGLPGFKVNGIEVNQSHESQTVTNDDGSYYLNELGAYNQYEITPDKNDNPLDGLTTLDLVLIQKHILGIKKFDSPYKYIAADANNSNSVSASDLLELRKLILGTYDELPTKESWKFMIANSEFDNPGNPWYYDDKYITDSLLYEIDSLDFIAVKIGDINHSADVFTANTSMLEDRNDKTNYFMTDNISFVENQVVPLDFRLEEEEIVSGFQFTLKYDPTVLDFVNVEKNSISLTSANINAARRDQGIITFSWNAASGLNLFEDQSLFKINFKSITSGSVKDVIAITSDLTKAEIYNDELKVSNLELRFSDDSFDAIKLYQNNPNPFSNITEVLFDLPEDSNVSFKIYDSKGSILKTTHRHYSKGQNSILITGSDLKNQGIYFYELKTDKSTFVKRMVYIR